ncbi:MAG: hypothetical protein KAS87_05670 [Candidatus Omnitrophica bacterium]|nr:hypothetical protein [Candidatus Omnitrophota bacterium]
MNKKTAILVIHGIGEQEPFETLDNFVRPFADSYLKQIRTNYPDASIQKRHSLKQFPNWIESCVSLIPSISNKPTLDIYEYYWAHKTQRKISSSEVVQWLLDVGEGAKAFYKRQGQKEREKNDILFTRDGEFNYVKYLINMLSFTGWLRGLLRCLNLVVVHKPIWIKVLSKVVGYILKRPLVDSLGDIALYTSADRKSEYFDVRQAILKEAVEKAKFLIENKEYERVILAGHSLGSVIAYDTLSRLNKEMNVDSRLREYASKLKGLITFGSPLDKIAFFFDEKINKKKQNIRYAIVSQLNGFKRVNVDTTTLDKGIEQYFEHVKWLNFWSGQDPVSGHLDIYRDVKNIVINFSERIKGRKRITPQKAHLLYWQSEEMYRKIISSLLG